MKKKPIILLTGKNKSCGKSYIANIMLSMFQNGEVLRMDTVGNLLLNLKECTSSMLRFKAILLEDLPIEELENLLIEVRKFTYGISDYPVLILTCNDNYYINSPLIHHISCNYKAF